MKNWLCRQDCTSSNRQNRRTRAFGLLISCPAEFTHLVEQKRARKYDQLSMAAAAGAVVDKKKPEVSAKHRVRPPKRVRTAFAFFIQDNFNKIAIQLNTRSPLSVMKVLARKWHKAPEILKDKYRKRSAKDRERFNVSQKLWKKLYIGQPPKIMERSDLKKSRRAHNACKLFERDAWKNVHVEHPDWDEHMIIKELAHRWYGLADEQRQYYLQLAVLDVKTYKRKMRDYKLFKSRRALCVHMSQGRVLFAKKQREEQQKIVDGEIVREAIIEYEGVEAEEQNKAAAVENESNNDDQGGDETSVQEKKSND